MNYVSRFFLLVGALLAVSMGNAAVPVPVSPVLAKRGVVVAGHPQAAEAGVAVLRTGGNAIDAAIATSLSLGVAEPYASGLGGKLMLLYYEAASGQIYVVEAMDAAPSIDVATYLRRPAADRHEGYSAVCVPGLAAGLWLAHQKWGSRAWSDDLQPAIALARGGFQVLPKSRDLFEEQVARLRGGDPEIARLYLVDGQIPALNVMLPNPDLAHTLELLARQGRDGFYRGPVAQAIVTASAKGGGAITLADLANYSARLTDTVGIDFRGYRIESAPPPANGAAMFMTALKVLEEEKFEGGSLRTSTNLDRLGRVWRVVEPEAYRLIGDTKTSRHEFERLTAPASVRNLRRKAFAGLPVPAAASLERRDETAADSPMAATTHFIVIDSQGNVVCATQSLSTHFGAGVVAPGTGVVLNNSMSNFDYLNPANPDYVAPGRRPRSTLSPTFVLLRGQPVLALGVPGAARIPTAMLQVLLDYLALHRRLGEAIGDTRFHFMVPWKPGDVDTFEAEQSLPGPTAAYMHALGWKVDLSEPAGTGRHFGGVNAVEMTPDGLLTAFADPRRTNAAVGY
jgi:gamma-glutamyltranspeptidase/glutathione hydrolase